MAGRCLSARSVVSGIQKKLAATRAATAARSLFCAISASSLRKSSKLGSLAVFGRVIGRGLYGPRAAEGGCGPGVAGTGVWEGASVWAKTKFRSTPPSPERPSCAAASGLPNAVQRLSFGDDQLHALPLLAARGTSALWTNSSASRQLLSAAPLPCVGQSAPQSLDALAAPCELRRASRFAMDQYDLLSSRKSRDVARWLWHLLGHFLTPYECHSLLWPRPSHLTSGAGPGPPAFTES